MAVDISRLSVDISRLAVDICQLSVDISPLSVDMRPFAVDIRRSFVGVSFRSWSRILSAGADALHVTPGCQTPSRECHAAGGESASAPRNKATKCRGGRSQWLTVMNSPARDLSNIDVGLVAR